MERGDGRGSGESGKTDGTVLRKRGEAYLLGFPVAYVEESRMLCFSSGSSLGGFHGVETPVNGLYRKEPTDEELSEACRLFILEGEEDLYCVGDEIRRLKVDFEERPADRG